VVLVAADSRAACLLAFGCAERKLSQEQPGAPRLSSFDRAALCVQQVLNPCRVALSWSLAGEQQHNAACCNHGPAAREKGSAWVVLFVRSLEK
jgi:hypothetical protein